MSHIDSHVPGTFCWIELATSDQQAAKAFYGAVLGWSPVDYPMGPDEVYTMFKLDGRDAAAAYKIKAQSAAECGPPHWMIYVSVENASDTAAKAASLGANVVAPAFDVMTFGRMAVIQDPGGAHFAVWEPKSHKGTGIAKVPGTLCWADISVDNPDAATAFYSGLFGWKFSKGMDDSGYLHIQNGEQYIGGVPPAAHRKPGVPPHWLAYFEVADVDAAATTASNLGAKLFLPPMTMEKVGRMSVIQDPQGAVFAIFKGAGV